MCLPGTEHALGAGGAGGAAQHPPVRARDAAGAPPAFAGANRLDLTHLLRAGFPVSVFDAPTREPALRFDEHGYYSQTWRLQEHTATHVDAPAHFYAGARFAPQIPLDELVVNVAVIDVRDRAAEDPDTLVTVDDLLAWERRHGELPSRAGIFMDSGWDVRAADADAYPNRGTDGRFHSPGFGAEAVVWLLERRDVVCFGVDTLSLDHGVTDRYPAHQAILSAGRYGVEGLARLGELPPVGAVANVGLVPFEQGSGGPARVTAAW